MTDETNGTAAVHRLERNNYFYGKLLTVRDMAAEQAYHVGLQRTLSRFVSDYGGICGLAVDHEVVPDPETGEESLAVTVHEGLALDRCGRLVVIEDEQRETLPLPPMAEGVETDTVSVYVEYDECLTDPVPAPKVEHACEDDCEDNRLVETARVTVVPGAPDDRYKSIADVDFPDPTVTKGATDLDGLLSSLARSYYEEEPRADCATDVAEGPVLVGTLTSESGDWSLATFERGPLVYSNDLLFDVLARHVADFDNPHDVTAAQAGALVSVEGRSNPGGNVDLRSSDDSIAVETPAVDPSADPTIDLRVAEAIQQRLDDLVERMGAAEQRLDGLAEQFLQSTLHHTRLVFRLVEDRHGSTTANDVVQLAGAALADRDHEDPNDYLEFAGSALPEQRDVAAELDGAEGLVGLARFEDALDGLEAVLAEDATDLGPLALQEHVLEVGHAQALVAETAEWMAAQEPFENPTFTEAVYTVEAGGTANVTLSSNDAESLEFQLGGADSGYTLRATMEPAPDQQVTLTFDTSLAGAGQTPLAAQPDVSLQVVEETSLDGLLDVGTYDLALRVPATNGIEVAAASLVVEAPPVDLTSLEDSLVFKRDTFQVLAESFNLPAAAGIVELAVGALDDGAHQDADAYRQFIDAVLDTEEVLAAQLVELNAFTIDSLRTYVLAVVALGDATRNEADVQTLKDRQNAVTQAAADLERGDIVIDVAFEPQEVTVATLEDEVTTIEDEQQLADLLVFEMAGDNRVTAREAIVNRLRELQSF